MAKQNVKILHRQHIAVVLSPLYSAGGKTILGGCLRYLIASCSGTGFAYWVLEVHLCGVMYYAVWTQQEVDRIADMRSGQFHNVGAAAAVELRTHARAHTHTHTHRRVHQL